MSFKDTLNQKLMVICYHLTTEQILSARRYRNWEEFDKLEDVQKMQLQLEEFSIYEDILLDITDDDFYRILKEINASDFNLK